MRLSMSLSKFFDLRPTSETNVRKSVYLLGVRIRYSIFFSKFHANKVEGAVSKK